jgi:hypothetical protein
MLPESTAGGFQCETSPVDLKDAAGGVCWDPSADSPERMLLSRQQRIREGACS